MTPGEELRQLYLDVEARFQAAPLVDLVRGEARGGWRLLYLPNLKELRVVEATSTEGTWTCDVPVRVAPVERLVTLAPTLAAFARTAASQVLDERQRIARAESQAGESHARMRAAVDAAREALKIDID